MVSCPSVRRMTRRKRGGGLALGLLITAGSLAAGGAAGGVTPTYDDIKPAMASQVYRGVVAWERRSAGHSDIWAAYFDETLYSQPFPVDTEPGDQTTPTVIALD